MRFILANASQSPYGAKWFATRKVLEHAVAQGHGDLRRNPLTGLSGLQQTQIQSSLAFLEESQSPYGAKWFATQPDLPPGSG